MNRLLLDALACRKTHRPPIWIMRQAGRYMPEYRDLRKKNSFETLCHTPELIAEVTALPIKTFGFDAAILFSDILIILEAFHKNVKFVDAIGPVVESPISTSADVQHLSAMDPKECLQCVEKGIKLIKSQLRVPLIGFCGAPFTVGSYLIEGGSSKDLKKTKQWLLRDPTSFHQLMDKLTSASVAYLKMQADAGVDAIQIFDSWANFLGHHQFREFSLHYLQKLVKAVQELNIPVILFCKGSSVFAPHLAEIKPNAISIDWQANLIDVRKNIPSDIALQGNLDPDILYADHQNIHKEAQRLIAGMQKQPGYIFNLGHGIHPDTPVEAVKVLVETVCTSSS